VDGVVNARLLASERAGAEGVYIVDSEQQLLNRLRVQVDEINRLRAENARLRNVLGRVGRVLDSDGTAATRIKQLETLLSK
jgi:hypothetical protein